MLVGFDFCGVAWVDVDEDVLINKGIDLENDEDITRYAWKNIRGLGYTVGGEPLPRCVEISREGES